MRLFLESSSSYFVFMKICILTPRFPFPENGGDVLRINNIARYLKVKGHSLVLVSLSDTDQPDIEGAKTLYDYVYVTHRNHALSLIHGLFFMLSGRPIQCGYYHSSAYRKLLKEVVEHEQPDLFISHLLRMSPYLEHLHVEAQSIVEMTDALSKTYVMSANAKGGGLKKWVYNVERNLIRKYEQHVIHTFPKVVLVSQADVDFLRQSALPPHISALSLKMYTNGVNCMDQLPDAYDENKICFVGNMRTLQNQDAVLYFVKDVFPLIKKEKPTAKFYIVGAEPSQSIQDLASDDVVVTGFVDDLEANISDSCLAVAPVRVAAGIQNKVLVTMGCGLPVVMSSLISKAIPELRDGENCFICDEAEDIARRCLQLMEDSAIRDTLGRNGYEMVRQNYSWTEKLHGYELL